MRTAKVIRAAIGEAQREDFRVVEFCVMGNHLHLIAEATNQERLARGMQGLAVRLARRLNTVLERRGKLFATRYHARALRSPREVRNAIRYVLLSVADVATGGGIATTWGDRRR